MVLAVSAGVPHSCYGQLDPLSQSMGLRIRSMIQRWLFTRAMEHCWRLTTIGQMTRTKRVKLWPAGSLQKVPSNQRSLPYYRRAITPRSCEGGTERKVSPCSMRINCPSPIFAREQWRSIDARCHVERSRDISNYFPEHPARRQSAVATLWPPRFVEVFL